MTTIVSFEISKLLKEKKFNKPCQFLRVGGKYRINYEKEGDLFNNGIPSTQKPIDWFLAPTIAEVVIWLYEKYGIWISVDMVFAEDKTGFWYCIRESKINDSDIQSDEYDSIEKAYEEAIEYTLKNII